MNTLTLPPPAARRQPAPPLCLALLSHTNVGKTTLARTLLRRDVGEVRDAAGVSQQIERHRWLQAEGGEALDLLDTPGWHGASELLDRLQSTLGPWRWLRREALDRWRRPQLWQQQRDLQTVRDSADLLLYLVNAHESPDD
ncbi:GTPase, partial [Ideonella sp.]|uniref:GTPase n=1 Tax=Ideonella sp. TaxID=1929293 RepID=UPI003BB6792D